MTTRPGPVEKAERLAKEGRFEEAIRIYDEALAASPDDLPLIQKKAYALFAAGKLEEARREYDKALRIHSDDPDLWRARGVVSEQMTDFDEALKSYDTALSLIGKRYQDPTAPPEAAQLLADKGDVLVARGEYADALEHYHRAAKASGVTAGDWNLWGDRFYRAGSAKEALACYDEAIKLDPRHFQAWWGKGLAAVLANDIDTALSALNEAQRLASQPADKAKIFADKGDVLGRFSDRFREALECYEQALAADPEQPAAYLGRALALENLGRFPEAIDAYDRLLALNPNRTDAWQGRGRCLLHSNQMQEALECFDKAVSLEPNSAWVHSDRGWVLTRLKRYEEALAEYDAAIRIEPKGVTPWGNKGFTLLELGRFQECQQIVKEGIQIVSDPRELLRLLGALYSEYTFEEEKALEVEQELLKIAPSDPLVRTAHAESLLRVGRYSEARDYARGVEESQAGAFGNIAAFIEIASYVLEGKLKETQERFARFVPCLADPDRTPITEDRYYFRGLIKRISEGNADPVAKFVLLTLIDLLTGKLDFAQLSFGKPGSPPAAISSSSLSSPQTNWRGFTDRKLGRNPRSYDPRIPHMSALLAGKQVAPPPPRVDYTAGMPAAFGTMLNDTLGDAVCAAFYHALQVMNFKVQNQELSPPDSDVEKLYIEACGYNPEQGGPGPGGDLQEVLRYILAWGAPLGPVGRHKILGFVEVDPRNLDDVKSIIHDCCAALIGFKVPRSIIPPTGEPPSVWTYDPANSEIIGGHAVAAPGYDAEGLIVISWGQRYKMTWQFFSKFVDEVYAIVDTEWVQAGGNTPAGITVAQLEAKMQALKGGAVTSA